VRDAGDYTISMVDDLLNVLTSGEHSKVMAMLAQVRGGRMRHHNKTKCLHRQGGEGDTIIKYKVQYLLERLLVEGDEDNVSCG